jgi:glycosyltransferase involved in cell wall biosynthesis
MREMVTCPNPRVTVLMAVYNGDRFLEEAIGSILRQTFADFEFIIIDDASTDTTRELLTLAAEQDERILLLYNNANLGLAASLNRGMALAKGAFIARMDADDVAHPERLSRQLSLFESTPDLVMAGSAYWVIDGEGRTIRKDSYPLDDTSIRWQMLFQNSFLHSSVMIRSDILIPTVLKYDENCRYAQDYEFWSRLLAFGIVANSEEPLISYRLQEDTSQRKAAYREQQAVATQVAMNNVLKLGVHINEQEMVCLRDLYLDRMTMERAKDLRSYRLLLEMLDKFSQCQKIKVVQLAYIRLQLFRNVMRLRRSKVSIFEISCLAWGLVSADVLRFIQAFISIARKRIKMALFTQSGVCLSLLTQTDMFGGRW